MSVTRIMCYCATASDLPPPMTKRKGTGKAKPTGKKRARTASPTPSVEEVPPASTEAASEGTGNDGEVSASESDGPENEPEDAEAELGEYFGRMEISRTLTAASERLSKEWNASAYAFFRPEVSIGYKDGRRMHIFHCLKHGCKRPQGLNRFLDTGDSTSTGNLRKHIVACWGAEALKAADGTASLPDARTGVEALMRNGSIPSAFKRIQKNGAMSYSTRQHTFAQLR